MKSLKLKKIDEHRSRVIFGKHPTRYAVRRIFIEDVPKYVIDEQEIWTNAWGQLDLFPYETQYQAVHAIWSKHYKG